jgi:putative endonuclease
MNTPPRSSAALGRHGEDRVASLLETAGWTVLGRNVRDGPRELDLVVRRGKLVAFVEVKSRSRADRWPLESITWKKRQHLARAARRWILDHGRAGDCYRFDVAVVIARVDEAVRVELLEDAWRIHD